MRVKAIVSYKGSRYYGWQKQDNQITVQGCIESVLSKILDVFSVIPSKISNL